MAQPGQIDWTLWIAIYGAITATVALLLDYYNAKRDVGHLVLEASIGKYVQGGRGALATNPPEYLILSVANAGRRPVTVDSLVLRKPRALSSFWKQNGGYWIHCQGISNETIMEADVRRGVLLLTKELHDAISKGVAFEARDVSGNFYRLPRQQLRQLKVRLLESKSYHYKENQFDPSDPFNESTIEPD